MLLGMRFENVEYIRMEQQLTKDTFYVAQAFLADSEGLDICLEYVFLLCPTHLNLTALSLFAGEPHIKELSYTYS